MKNSVFLFAALSVLFMPVRGPHAAVPWIEGVVTEVVDGDTVKARLNFTADPGATALNRGIVPMTDDHYARPGEYTIELSQIDAPELAQSRGKTAQKNLIDKVLNKNIRITEESSREVSGAISARIWYQNEDQKWLDLNRTLVSEGMAWSGENAADPELKETENEARKAKKGVFADDNPMPPWIFRAGKKKARRPSPSWVNCAGQKKTCRQMETCDQAIFYLKRCFQTELDLDGNGIPCENTVCGAPGTTPGY